MRSQAQRMSCGAGWSLREALSSTRSRLRFPSLFPRQRLQPLCPVGKCRQHFYSPFFLWGGIDCNRFCGKILRGSGHAHPPSSAPGLSRGSTVSREACRADPIKSEDAHSIDLNPSLVKKRVPDGTKQVTVQSVFPPHARD